MKYKYKGYLTIYFETGISPTPILQDLRGVSSNYWNLSWAFFFEREDVLTAKIYNKENKIVFNGILTFKIDFERQMPIPNEISLQDWTNYLNKSFLMEMETERGLHIFQTKINLPTKNYTLIEKAFDGDIELFTGELMSHDLYLDSYLQMRSKKEGEILYSKFYNSKEKIKSFHFLSENNILIILNNGKTLILKENP